MTEKFICIDNYNLPQFWVNFLQQEVPSKPVGMHNLTDYINDLLKPFNGYYSLTYQQYSQIQFESEQDCMLFILRWS